MLARITRAEESRDKGNKGISAEEGVRKKKGAVEWAGTDPDVLVCLEKQLQVAAVAQHVVARHAVDEHVEGPPPLLNEVGTEAELLCAGTQGYTAKVSRECATKIVLVLLHLVSRRVEGSTKGLHVRS
jgi:hypothetical protein